MVADHLILYLLLGSVVILLVTEWVPLEVTALLTMGSLALTGLVAPREALAGFGSPAVVTIWAVFILSGALDRTGVADQIGRLIQRLSGRSEIGLTTTLMLGAGIMSAFMNNVAVAALMLPVTMDLARANRIPPSRLLMPLAYGSLLGGLMTMIGTPPNILVSSALKDAGLKPFSLFDFSPPGILILLGGTAFMVCCGRLMLPQRDVAGTVTRPSEDLPEQYHLQERTFTLTLPYDNLMVGRTLSQSRLGAATGLYVVAIIRQHRTIIAPHPDETLQAGDQLFVQGRLERFSEIQALISLIDAEQHVDVERLMTTNLGLCELQITSDSGLADSTLADRRLDLPEALQVLALRRDDQVSYAGLDGKVLQTGDRLLLCGEREGLEHLLQEQPDLDIVTSLETQRLQRDYQVQDHLLHLHLVESADLIDISLDIHRMEEILGLKVLSVLRDGRHHAPLGSELSLTTGDQVLALEVAGHLDGLRGLASLYLDDQASPADLLRSGQVGLAEAVLAPRSGLVGKTLRQLRFREHFGLGALAIWRAGRAYRSNLRDMTLEFGDALLLFGPSARLQALAGNPDLIVLSRSAQEPRRREKAWLSSAIMAATLLPVLIGWVPIYLAVVMGAAGMVMARCLTMEEAYRAIEWRAVFLIAGLLPLGTALEQTGVAATIARQVAELAAGYGPVALMVGLVLMTFVATCIIPTAALVLLMAPIALQTAEVTGLSPHALLMAIALAASSSFLTPIAHPANILVMGPGGYRFRDYLVVGFPLTLVVFLIIVLVVPWLWPLAP